MIRILLFLGLCAIIEKSYGDEQVVKYLLQYGYLEPHKKGATPNSFSDDEYQSALKKAQKFAGIPATGKLDNQTRKMLRAARCGVPDTGSYRLKRYNLYGTRWPTRQISYSFMNYSPNLTVDGIEKTFRKAYDTWARPTGLQFIHMHSDRADMQIGFFRGDHGDGDPFDGLGPTLAHATFPDPITGGDIHVDDDESWSTDENNLGGNFSLLWVAIHESGHALGLQHSYERGSIMGPFYTGISKLGEDDILGIQALYG